MISIIIPTLNEELNISECIESITGDNFEIIVVDAQSEDNTVQIAELLGAQTLISSVANRAVQMNLGADHANGDIFLFFHADSRLPKGGLKAINKTLKDKSVIGGGFNLLFFPNTIYNRFLAFLSNAFCRLTNIILGDRGFFIRREDFYQLGQFPVTDIMEDADLSFAIQKKGKLKILPFYVRTSARKYKKESILQIIYRTSWSYIAYRVGVSREKIYKQYYGLNK